MTLLGYIYERVVLFSLILSVLLLASFFIFSNKKYKLPLTTFALFTFLYVLATDISLHAPTEASAIFWFVKVRSSLVFAIYSMMVYMSLTSIPSLGRNFTKPLIFIFVANILVYCVLIFFPGIDPYLYSSITMIREGGLWLRESWVPGILNTYQYIFIAVSFFLAVYYLRESVYRVLTRKPQSLRDRQSTIFILGMLLPYGVTILYSYDLLGDYTKYNLLPFFSVLYALYVFVFIGKNFIYTLPLSKNWLFNNLPDRVFLLSSQDELLDLNRSARQWIQGSDEEVLGQKFVELHPELSHLLSHLISKDVERTVWKTEGPAEDETIYEVVLSRIKNPNGVVQGKILSFHDITLEEHQKDNVINALNLYERLENRFRGITLQKELGESMQQALLILAELVKTDRAEIYIKEGKRLAQVACLDTRNIALDLSTVLKQLTGQTPIIFPEQILLTMDGKGAFKETLSEGANPGMSKLRVIVFPLTSTGELIGYLIISRVIGKGRVEFKAEEIRKIEAYSYRTGIFLNEILQVENKQVESRADERQRIAREMHDSVSQSLRSAQMYAGFLGRAEDKLEQEDRQHLATLNSLLDGASQEMRTLLYELRPSSTDKLSLSEMVESLLDASRLRTRARLIYENEHHAEPPLHVKLALYRVIQEALNNAIRHSRASRIRVRLGTGSGNRLNVLIDDDGIGLNIDKVSPGTHGLAIMRERMHAIGADLSFQSGMGQKTEVSITWPAGEEEKKNG